MGEVQHFPREGCRRRWLVQRLGTQSKIIFPVLTRGSDRYGNGISDSSLHTNRRLHRAAKCIHAPNATRTTEEG